MDPDKSRHFLFGPSVVDRRQSDHSGELLVVNLAVRADVGLLKQLVHWNYNREKSCK